MSEDHHSPLWRLANTTDVQLTLGRLVEMELPSVKSHIYHRYTHDTLTKSKILIPCVDSSLFLWAAILLCWPHMAIRVDPSGEWEAQIWLLVPSQAPHPVYLQFSYGTLPPVDFLSCTWLLSPPHNLESSSKWTCSASHLLESSFSFRTWKSLNLEYQFKVMG